MWKPKSGVELLANKHYCISLVGKESQSICSLVKRV